jgi:RNA-directed DNA polymerase
VSEERKEEVKHPETLEEWIEQVRRLGQQEAVTLEMIRLGFWEEKELTPEERAEQEREDAEYQRLAEEYAQLSQEMAKIGDIKKLLREARKKRIEESRRLRAERKAEREKREAERKKRWEAYKGTHVVHAGLGVSAGLQSFEHDEEKLMAAGLPLIRSALELADAMEMPLGRLKWLTYHRNAATVCHYHRFTIPKRSGGVREISAPKPQLRRAQEWIKREILDRLPVHSAACGFIPGKSVVDNARLHLGQAAVIKMDLKDFFPGITFWRVRGLFQSFGYSEAIATLLALLTTEPPRRPVEFDGKIYHVALGERQLPQGACTSPAITNLLCRRLDERLSGLAEKHGFRYSRYADDLTFSCPAEKLDRIGAVIGTARSIIRFEGFEVNEEKTRVLRATSRQKVTGVVVNEKPNISRKELRNFRALLHQVEKNGPDRENRIGHPRFWEYILGYAGWIRMVRPDLEGKLAEKLARIGEKHRLPVAGWVKEAAVKG